MRARGTSANTVFIRAHVVIVIPSTLWRPFFPDQSRRGGYAGSECEKQSNHGELGVLLPKNKSGCLCGDELVAELFGCAG